MSRISVGWSIEGVKGSNMRSVVSFGRSPVIDVSELDVRRFAAKAARPEHNVV